MSRFFELAFENYATVWAVAVIAAAILVHLLFGVSFGAIAFVIAAGTLLVAARLHDEDEQEE